MNFFKFFIGDYQRDTMRLTLLEDGAYSRLLREYYATEQPLPADLDECCLAARAFSAEERAAVEKVLDRYFTRDGDVLRNSRADREIGEYHALCEDRAEAGRRGAEARWAKDGKRMANAWQTHGNCHRQKSEPEPESKSRELEDPPLSSSRTETALVLQPTESRATPTRRIFDHWRSVFQHPKARLDDKRRTCIQRALKDGYSEDQLIDAISGAAKTPHNCGFNEQGQVYDAITLILRNADQIDRFIRNCHNPPEPPEGHRAETTRQQIERLAREGRI